MTRLSLGNIFLTLLILSQPLLSARATDKQKQQKVVSSHTDIQGFIKDQEPELYGCDLVFHRQWRNAMDKPMTAAPIELPLIATPQKIPKTKADPTEIFTPHHIRRFPGSSGQIKPLRTAPAPPLIPSAKGSRQGTLTDQFEHRPTHEEIRQFTRGYRDRLYGANTP